MHVLPITCLRPNPPHAAEFAALPYDVFTDEEARAYVQDHPTSFLAIDRPETGFEPGHDASAPEVFEHAAKLLRERQLDRTLVPDEHPCFYLYELTQGDHRQLGVMGAVAVDDYLDGTVARHELTLPAKELDRVRHITGLRAQTGPVFLAYRDSMALDVILDTAKQATPMYDFVSMDGVRQRVWRIARPVAVEAISLTFTTVERAYVADGHHRAAAAACICEERRAEGRKDDPAEQFLAVLFPASQLRILPYDRVVANAGGITANELLQAITREGFSINSVECGSYEPQCKGRFGMYHQGVWHELQWNGSSDELDVAILQEHLLRPVLNICDPRTDERLSFVGNPTSDELELLAGADGIAFSLFPTSLDELMAVADAGELMPPKSTWFEPKLQSGLAIRRIW